MTWTVIIILCLGQFLWLEKKHVYLYRPLYITFNYGNFNVVFFFRPRFGQKKNSQLLETASSDLQKIKKIEKGEFSDEKSLFDGTKAGSVVINTDTGSSAPEVMTSDELLTRMRRRNVVSGNSTTTTSIGAENNEENQQDDDSSTLIVDDDSFKLITEIRNFIMFECQTMCKGTTQEILDEFGPRLPPAETAKFKSMLKSICDFDKVDGIGYWRLKNSFRWHYCIC